MFTANFTQSAENNADPFFQKIRYIYMYGSVNVREYLFDIDDFSVKNGEWGRLSEWGRLLE